MIFSIKPTLIQKKMANLDASFCLCVNLDFFLICLLHRNVDFLEMLNFVLLLVVIFVIIVFKNKKISFVYQWAIFQLHFGPIKVQNIKSGCFLLFGHFCSIQNSVGGGGSNILGGDHRFPYQMKNTIKYAGIVFFIYVSLGLNSLPLSCVQQ